MPKPLTFDTVIFDLDGTLVDTAPDFICAINHALRLNGRRELALKDILGQVGAGGRAMLKTAYELTGAPASPELIDKSFGQFLAYYNEHTSVASKPYEGCIALLQQLKNKGARLGVCTNKFEALALKLLKELDMLQYFGAVVGQDTIKVAKPDPAPLFETIARLGGSRKSAVMVGDSNTDILTAKNAGIPAIAVTFGYSDQPIKTLGADYAVDHYDNMQPLLISA